MVGVWHLKCALGSLPLPFFSTFSFDGTYLLPLDNVIILKDLITRLFGRLYSINVLIPVELPMFTSPSGVGDVVIFCKSIISRELFLACCKSIKTGRLG